MNEWLYTFEWERTRTLQSSIREYVSTHFYEIENKDGGTVALEFAINQTRKFMEKEEVSEQVIEEQCEELALSMLQFEIFNKFIGEV